MSRKGAIDLSTGAKMLEGGREDFKGASVIPAAHGFSNFFHAITSYDAGREAERIGARVRVAMNQTQEALHEYYDKKNSLEDFRIRASIESELDEFSSQQSNDIAASIGTKAEDLHDRIGDAWTKFVPGFEDRISQINDPKVQEVVRLQIKSAQTKSMSTALGQQTSEGVKIAEQDFKAALDRVVLNAKKNPSLVFAEGGGVDMINAANLGGMLVKAGASPAMIDVAVQKAQREAASAAFGTELDLAQAEGYRTGSMAGANKLVEKYKGLVDDDVLAAAKKQNDAADNSLRRQREFEDRLAGSDMIVAGSAAFSQNTSEVRQFLSGNAFDIQRLLKNPEQVKGLQERLASARNAAQMKSDGYRKKGMSEAAAASMEKDAEELAFLNGVLLGKLAELSVSKPTLTRDRALIGPTFNVEDK